MCSGGIYNSRSPYTIWVIFSIDSFINRRFHKVTKNVCRAFDDFRNNRLIVANRQATARGIDVNNPINLDAEGLPNWLRKK
jgi:hypothetical protein